MTVWMMEKQFDQSWLVETVCNKEDIASRSSFVVCDVCIHILNLKLQLNLY